MNIGESIIKHWKWYAIATALVSIGGWVYNQGVSDMDVESRLFKSKEMKYRTETYMEQKLSPAQEQRAYILDSLNKTSAIKSRAKRDSTYQEEVKARMVEAKARRKTDSILYLNADQMYQIKEELKRIKQE